jgi:hypothetical protein
LVLSFGWYALFGAQVSALETIVGKGGKVVDADVVTLTEALMNELVKLDSITADGEFKVQRRMQVSAHALRQSMSPLVGRIQSAADSDEATGCDGAGEEGAEVRGDAGRHPRQERGGAQGQRQWSSERERARQGPCAAPPAACVAAAELQGARGGDRRGSAHAEMGDVRPTVISTVHVLSRRDHHHGGRDHHLSSGRDGLPDPAVRLGALMMVEVRPGWSIRRYIPLSMDPLCFDH